MMPMILTHHTRTLSNCRVEISKISEQFSSFTDGRREAKEEGRGGQEEAGARGQAHTVLFYLTSAHTR